MQRANNLTAQLVEAQLLTQAAQEEAALEAKKAAEDASRRANYEEQRLALERGFFLDLGSLISEVREQKHLIRDLLNQTPLSEALYEFTDEVRKGHQNHNQWFGIIFRFIQAMIPYLARTAPAELKQLSQDIERAIAEPRLESLKEQLQEWYTSLNDLQEKEATFAGDTPVHLTRQIERARNEIERITQEISELQKNR